MVSLICWCLRATSGCGRKLRSRIWRARRRAQLRWLDNLEGEADAIAASAFTIGHIAIGCALAYLDFRFAEQDWRKRHRRLSAWHAAFTSRPSVQATLPVDDS